MENKLSDAYSATGTLVVTASTAGGALPVAGALVTVRGASPENSGVLATVSTDRSGRTPRIMLPTPPAADSEKPGMERPYATYNIEVEKDGFFHQSFTNVPLFAGTTSIQPVNLYPLTEYAGDAQDPNPRNTDESGAENPGL